MSNWTRLRSPSSFVLRVMYHNSTCCPSQPAAAACSTNAACHQHPTRRETLLSCNTWRATTAARVPVRPLCSVEARSRRGFAAIGNSGAISLLQAIDTVFFFSRSVSHLKLSHQWHLVNEASVSCLHVSNICQAQELAYYWPYCPHLFSSFHFLTSCLWFISASCIALFRNLFV